MKSPSRLAWLFSSVVIALVTLWYLPRWKEKATNSVLGWDVSGYYLYLPAVFIHHDVKELRFREEMMRKYAPTPDFYQAFRHPESGNFVMKYPAGMALQYLPFFLAAHAIAGPAGYPADGFSAPYQMAILLASLAVAVLSLWLVRRALLPRFGEWPTALTLLILVLGSNYLDYSSLGGAMTHSWLFLWYAVLLLLTPAFYRRPTLGRAIAIGAVLGLMVLTRPTEILAALIPILWGLRPAWASLRERLGFWQQHLGHLAAAVLAAAALISIQPLYWHYVSGDWVVYSYQDQGFSWLRPHLWEGIFSFKSGWLLYSPLLFTALVGFVFLRRQQPEAFWAMLIFLVLFIYVTFAWDVWTYGGSLGQRAMVQSYAVQAWPMAAALRWLLAQKRLAVAYGVLAVLGCYYNLWLTHQAHRGGLLIVGEMTRTYWLRILGRYDVPLEARLLLDTNSYFSGTPRNQRVLWQQDFEQPGSPEACGAPALEGNCSLVLNAQHPLSQEYVIPARPGQFEWVRASALARTSQPEWSVGHMSQYVVRFRLGKKMVKERTVHFQRALEPNWSRELHFYMRPPEEAFDNVAILFVYRGTSAYLVFDNAKLEAFDGD